MTDIFLKENIKILFKCETSRRIITATSVAHRTDLIRIIAFFNRRKNLKPQFQFMGVVQHVDGCVVVVRF